MSGGAELAALITAIGVSIASIITAIAALMNSRYSAAKIVDLEKSNERLERSNEKLQEDNKRLSAENDKKTDHNEYQDQVIFNQQRKIDQWMAWGQRIGQKMNKMELQIGASHVGRHVNANDDTQPIPTGKDWITGNLGPIDVASIKKLDNE